MVTIVPILVMIISLDWGSHVVNKKSSSGHI